MASLGYRFEVRTELDLRRLPRHRTINALLDRRHVEPPNDASIRALRDRLGAEGIARLGDLPSLIPGLLEKQIYRLILDGILAINLDAPLDAETRVALASTAPPL